MNAEAIVAIIAIVCAVLFGLLGAVWGLLRSQNAEQGRRILALEQENAAQSKELAGLTQRMIAREDAHAQHREDISNRLDRLEAKIDQLIRGPRRETPYGTQYSHTEKSR